MSNHCQLCGSTDLRASRVRAKDVLRLFMLQYPMRCWVCRNREYVSVLKLSKSGPDDGSQSAEAQ